MPLLKVEKSLNMRKRLKRRLEWKLSQNKVILRVKHLLLNISEL